ncbi:MAG: hypothetical protein ABMB14_32825 [Myxococcota bacterium]
MVLGWFAVAFADSPLTSVELGAAYGDVQAVADATTLDAALPLLVGDLPLDQKLAIVNRLGWGHEGQATALAQRLARKRGVPVEALRVEQLSSTDRIVFAYLRAMEDYLELTPIRDGATGVLGADPVGLAATATRDRPDDFAVAAVATLITTQTKLADGCAVWTTWDGVLRRFPPPTRNLRPAAVDAATDYLSLYRDDCPKPPPVPGKPVTDPEFDQVYALARLGAELVAATQAGLVVFDAEGRVRSATRVELCSSVEAVGATAWAGCEHALMRYDGGTWTEASHDGATREGGAYQVLPGGWLLHGGSLTRLAGAGPGAGAGGTQVGGAYTAAVDPAGRVWTIAFLDAITRGDRRFGVGSATYPGRDPRALAVGPAGAVWAVDFESGFFRHDAASDTFRPAEGAPTTRGSGVGFDPPRDRAWFLAYTAGLTLVEHGRVVGAVDLSAYEYLRSLRVDPDGTVWVAGWNGIARVRRTASGFDVTRFDAVR